MIFSGIELDADRFTCSPRGMILTMNGTVEAGGKRRRDRSSFRL